MEPVGFTHNYDSVSAFEVNTKLNKYFNIERMDSVELLDTPMMFEAQHEFYKPDIFGFQGERMDKEIEMHLSMRAYLLLKEEYPMSAEFITSNSDSDQYYFKAQVQNFKAPGRFAMGFLEEVEVVGSAEFIKYMQRLVQQNS